MEDTLNLGNWLSEVEESYKELCSNYNVRELLLSLGQKREGTEELPVPREDSCLEKATCQVL